MYGAEVWAPFIPRSGSAPGSRISKQVLAWLTGMNGARAARCRGWVMLRELDVEAESRALRILSDATVHGGLLARAVRQLQRNYENSGRSAQHTWMGRLRKIVRKVWPNFTVVRTPALALRGVPTFASGNNLPKQYMVDSWQQSWSSRQEALFAKPPNMEQQDFILISILRRLTEETAQGRLIPLQGAIFPCVPSIGHDMLQKLLRFLSGMTDFARVNAHNTRWNSLPGLRESDLKRVCLFCWTRDKRKFRDSEWHSVFDCKLCSAPRNRFRLALRSFPQLRITFYNAAHRRRGITIADDLAVLVTQIRSEERLVCDFARFVADILSTRQRAFRKLSVRDAFPPE